MKCWFGASKGWVMGEAGPGDLGWRAECLVQAGCIPWDPVLCEASGGERVPHGRPSELCFAGSKEYNKRKAVRCNPHHAFQLSKMFSSVLGEGGFGAVFIQEALLIPVQFSACTSYSRHVREHGTYFFLISWRSNKVSFETLCEVEGLSKLKSWIRCGSSCHVISPNVFMSASKTRARLSDLEKKRPREKLLHAIFNTLPSDFFFSELL